MAVNMYGPMQNHPPPNPNPIDLMAIKDIYPGMKNINVIFIILEIGPVTLTKENREVRTFKVADQSAAINVSIWDEPGKQLLPGDIVRLTKGYANVWRQSLTLYSGKNGEIVRLGDFCYTFNEMVNMSEPNPNLSASIPQPVLNNGSGGGPNGGNSNNGTGKTMGTPKPGPNNNPLLAASGPQQPKPHAATTRYSVAAAAAAAAATPPNIMKPTQKNSPRTGRNSQAKSTAVKGDRR
ncbi:SOSS complex subunit B homolog [Anopheles maculipalpis]|uniref:SOSS complex subunit B homolog n=1 Tax=Anopheles maculipalpis TaxID=1496333 RepID=UPI0021593D7D|nr:SOSS complex subunit B homolog [Anopheles maculipalpis]